MVTLRPERRAVVSVKKKAHGTRSFETVEEVLEWKKGKDEVVKLFLQPPGCVSILPTAEFEDALNNNVYICHIFTTIVSAIVNTCTNIFFAHGYFLFYVF